MTVTRLIGDIHGKFNDYRHYAIGDFSGPSIQIGDFAIGFGQSSYWHDMVNEYHLDTHRFIRGNHDNPYKCKEMVGYIPDGLVEDDVMFIGGAWSIDNPNAPPGWYKRTLNKDWWLDEECSDDQFEQFLTTVKTVKPRVMITHDCPGSVSYEMFWGSGFVTGPVYPNRTSAWMDKIFEAHQPEFWFFGHWHKTMIHKAGNTTFACLGELDTIDVDLANSDHINAALMEKFA